MTGHPFAQASSFVLLLLLVLYRIVHVHYVQYIYLLSIGIVEHATCLKFQLPQNDNANSVRRKERKRKMEREREHCALFVAYTLRTAHNIDTNGQLMNLGIMNQK